MVATDDEQVAAERYREFVEAAELKARLLNELRALDGRTLPQMIERVEGEIARLRSRIKAAPMTVEQLSALARDARAEANGCAVWMTELAQDRRRWQEQAEKAVDVDDSLAKEALLRVAERESQLNLAERQRKVHLAHAELIEHGLSLLAGKR
jgi:hypothetical protein